MQQDVSYQTRSHAGHCLGLFVPRACVSRVLQPCCDFLHIYRDDAENMCPREDWSCQTLSPVVKQMALRQTLLAALFDVALMVRISSPRRK